MVSSVARNLQRIGLGAWWIVNGTGCLPASVFAELPVGTVDELWLGPHAAGPSLSRHSREWLVHYVSGRYSY